MQSNIFAENSFNMQSLIKSFKDLLSLTPLLFKRYLYSEIAWSDRMLGIIGPRGVGKTTMILQYIKENLDVNETLYVQADDIYFANHTLLELAEEFSKNRGKYLFFFHTISVEKYCLTDIVEHKTDNFPVRHPLPLFKDYLRRGYYPFGTEDTMFSHRLNQIIIRTLETDIPIYANMNVATGKKLGKLLKIISQSVPFKPNFTKIAAMLEASRNNLDDYCYYMEQAGLIMQLRNRSEGIGQLGKVDKVYLDNTNLIFALAEQQQEVGNIRETVFLNQMRVKNDVYRSEKADFNIDNMTFEVGGKSKTQKQIEGLKNAYIVKDDIEYGYQNVIPLWAFGLNY